MASVLHKELEYEVEKLKYTYKKLEVIQPRFKKNPNFQLVIKPSRISSQEVLQTWLIKRQSTIY